METSSENDEDLRKLLKPKASVVQVLELLQKSYCKTSDEKSSCKVIKELDSYDDNNFKVQINDTNYLLKVQNGVESMKYMKNPTNSAIYLQKEIFKQLDKHGLSSSLPIPPIEEKVQDISGNDFPGVDFSTVSIHTLPVLSEDHSPRKLIVRLLKWVDGSTMSDAKTMSIETLVEGGIFLGKMDVALDALKVSSSNLGEWYHAWDQKHVSDLRPYLKYITLDQHRSMVESIICRFEQEILPVADQFRVGFLMNDFNDANIIMNLDSGSIAGVVDFGDSVKSWRVLEVTVAMAYAMLSTYGKTGHSVAAAAAILRGFTSVYKNLSALEKSHIQLLVVCRLATSVTLGAFSYHQNPENDYLLLHAKPAWDALELLTMNPDKGFSAAVDRLFDKACNFQTGVDEKNYTLLDNSDIAISDSELMQRI